MLDKPFLIFLLCQLRFWIAFSQDTSGIYLTKEDFRNETLCFKTSDQVRVTSVPSWKNFSISYDASPIKVNSNDNCKETFFPDTFFGFKSYGIKYYYAQKFEEYLACINDKPPFCMFVRKKVHFSGPAAFADEIFYYSRSFEEPILEFNNENIVKTYGDSTAAGRVLGSLLSEINRLQLDAEMNKKDYFKCKKLIADYLSQIP